MKNQVELELKQAWEDHLKLPFPRSPEYAPLSDLHAELAELDGFVAGIASSFLSGKMVNKRLVSINLVQGNNGFDHKLVELRSSAPEAEWVRIKEYKEHLNRLISPVIRLYTKDARII